VGPSVGQVVRSPIVGTMEEDGGMEVLEKFVLLAEQVEGDGHECTDKETPQEGIINCTRTIHLLWTEGTPENGSGEEGVDARTSEPILLIRCADIGDLGHLVVENAGTDKGRDKGGDHLTVEGNPGRDVDVMRELEILGEVEGVRGCDISVGLEVVHRRGISGEPETTKKLGDDA